MLLDMKRAATLQLQPFDINKSTKLLRTAGTNGPLPKSLTYQVAVTPSTGPL